MSAFDESEAIQLAQQAVLDRGIPVLGLRRVRKVSGALRAQYLPGKSSDFWLVTFDRERLGVDELADGADSPEELEILKAFSAENDTITVAVESDGATEIV